MIPVHQTILADPARHDLMCWCPLGQVCHATVLLDLANGNAVTPPAARDLVACVVEALGGAA